MEAGDNAGMSALGQGTWRMGEDPRRRAGEIAALQAGLDLEMSVIDTAEMYGEGAAEELVGEAIRGRREKVYLVSKAYPRNATKKELPLACERSLKRLGVAELDLYLLHWRGGVRLVETVEAFGRLQAAGKIRRWGVSNFDVADLEELGEAGWATDQVLYNPEHRGVELDLLPWCRERGLPVMAYSPVGEGKRLLESPVLRTAAEKHGATVAQVAIAWALRQPGVVAIPKAGSVEHVRENAAARELKLTPEDLRAVDRAYPPPESKIPLEML